MPLPETIDPRLQALIAGTENLPTLPAVALEVLRLCRAEDTQLDDLAAALEHDPALSAKLLRFANSSLYASGEEVRTLRRATLVLGLKTVQMMALSFSLTAAVPRDGRTGSYDYARYWRRSLVRAVSARRFATELALPSQDEAFLGGLLAEIGQVVLARGRKEAYDALIEQASREGDGWPRAEAERAALGFDHREVGSALLATWQIPTPLRWCVRYAGASAELPSDAPHEARELVQLLSLATSVAELLTSPTRVTAALAEVQLIARRTLGLEAERLNELLNGLEAPVREIADLLEFSWPNASSVAEILSQAQSELLRKSLGQARQLESLRTVLDLAAREDALRTGPYLDPLTGIANEAGLAFVLAQELRARLEGGLTRTLGVMRLDVDDFEALASPSAGEELERGVAGALRRVARKQDLAVRLAPGRFAILLGDGTPFGLRALAERVRQELALLSGHSAPPASLSLGGACLARVRTGGDGAALLQIAERLVARARTRGRGQAELHPSLLQGV